MLNIAVILVKYTNNVKDFSYGINARSLIELLEL